MPLKSWAEMLQEAGDINAPSTFEPIPDGKYELVITDAEHRQSQKGKDGYNITTEVEGGPYKGRKIFNTFWLSPESKVALNIFFRQMSNLGLPPEFWASEPSPESVCAGLRNKRFTGAVITSEYNGNQRNEIKDVFPARPGSAPVASGPQPPVPGAGPAIPSPVAAPPVAPVAAPQPVAPAPAPVAPPVAAPAAPAAPAAQPNPWATAPAAPADAGDPWAASPPPVPPMPGA